VLALERGCRLKEQGGLQKGSRQGGNRAVRKNQESWQKESKQNNTLERRNLTPQGLRKVPGKKSALKNEVGRDNRFAEKNRRGGENH